MGDRSLDDLVEAATYGELSLPGWDDDFEQLIARVNLVHVASPELGFPPLNEPGRRAFFAAAFEQCADLEQFELMAALESFVAPARLAWLDEVVPRLWKVGERAIPLDYSHETEPGEGVAFAPTARVQKAWLTGVDYHPFVCEGRVAVRLELVDERERRVGETFSWPDFAAGGGIE